MVTVILTKQKHGTRFILWLCLLLFAAPIVANDRQVNNEAFQRGEEFVFRAMYHSRLTGNVTAGDASLTIKPETVNVDGEPTMKIVGRANTRGVFNMFFVVENEYVSYFHEEHLAPVRFHKNVREGRHRRNADVRFQPDPGQVVSSDTIIEAPPFVQDIISAYYFARTFDMQGAQPGDAFEVKFYHSDEVYVSRIVFEGREEITTSLGTFRTLRFKPEMLEGKVFSQPYPMTLWVSDDENKMPIRTESGLVVGRARLDLVQFGGLKNMITSFVP